MGLQQGWAEGKERCLPGCRVLTAAFSCPGSCPAPAHGAEGNKLGHGEVPPAQSGGSPAPCLPATESSQAAQGLTEAQLPPLGALHPAPKEPGGVERKQKAPDVAERSLALPRSPSAHGEKEKAKGSKEQRGKAQRNEM